MIFEFHIFIRKKASFLLHTCLPALFLLIIAPPLFANWQEPLAKADTFFTQKKVNLATQLYETTLEELQNQKDWQTYLEISKRCYDSLQNHQSTGLAFNILKNSTKVLEPYSDEVESLLLAQVYHQLGIDHYNQYQEKEAIQAYQKAIDIRQKHLPFPNFDIAKGWFNIGVCYKELEDFSNALAFQEKALNAYRLLKRPKRLARTYRELGLINGKLGDLEQAKRYYAAALNLYEIHFQTEPWFIADLHTDLTALFEKQDSANLIIYHAQQALTLLQSFEDQTKQDYFLMANCYQNLGTAYDILEEYPKAIEQYQNAQKINHAYAKERQQRIAGNWLNIGVAYFKMGAFPQSETALQKALLINQQLQNPVNLSINIHDFGECFRHQKNWAKALEFYEKGFQYLVLDYNGLDWRQNPSPQQHIIIDKVRLLHQLGKKAKALKAWGEQDGEVTYLKAAIEVVDTAVILMDLVRLNYDFDGSKRFLTNLIRPTLETGVMACLSLYERTKNQTHLERAFAFVEKAKAVVLLDAVVENKAKLLSNVSPQQLQKEQNLKKNISAFQQLLIENKNSSLDSLSRWRNQIVLLTEQLSELRDSFELLNPQFATIRQTTPLSINQIQTQLLRKEEALIEYFLTQQQLLIFYLPKIGQLQVQQIDLDFSLEEYITSLQKGIAEKFTSKQNYTEQEQLDLDKLYAQNAFLLYEKLIQPLAQNYALPPKLRIIPDGILGYIPFDVLLENSPSNTDFTQFDFLAKRYNISYCYSAALLQQMQEHQNQAQKHQILAFAPEFPIQGLSDENILNNRGRLSPLFFNTEEVAAISEILPTQTFLKEQATKDNFELWADQYLVLHLSTHARVNDYHPKYSYIAFSQLHDSLDAAQLLFVDYLYASRLSADLVVLSACETGIGQLDKGEGIISLARAFSYSGAKSLITTLWRVNDQKTKDLMIAFYEGLAQKKEKDEALWQAKQQFIQSSKKLAHPYYWAGFVPIGNMEKVEVKDNDWIWGLGVGFLLVFGLFILRKKIGFLSTFSQ